MTNKTKRRSKIVKDFGFTIVELLVVIVIISILAVITIVSFTGISKRATVASMQSDLASSANRIKLYFTDSNDYYPAALDCSASPAANTVCLKASGGNTYSYQVNNASNPKTFTLTVTNGSLVYRITESTSAYEVATTVPILDNPTSASIASTTTTIGANIASDGGDAISATGTCWGLSPNPSTNCTTTPLGMLTGLPTTKITTSTPNYDLVVSNDGTSLYSVNNANPGLVSKLSRSTVSGALTALGSPTIAAGTAPHDVVISADGLFVYAINVSTCDISIYSRNVTTGELTSAGSVAAGTFPYGLAISPDGKSVYSANRGQNNITSYSRNVTTGALTSIGNIAAGTSTRSIVVSPDNTSVYAVNEGSNTISMYSRNTTTGALTALGTPTIAAGTTPREISISPDGMSVYVCGSTNLIYMYGRDTSTGALTAMSTPTVSTSYSGLSGIVTTQDGKSVYVTNYSYGYIYMFNRNTSTGILTALSPTYISIGSGVYGINSSLDNRSIYTAIDSQIGMYTRNTFSGAFVHSRTGMPANTLIYYRGYATNSMGTGYSNDGTFTTNP